MRSWGKFLPVVVVAIVFVGPVGQADDETNSPPVTEPAIVETNISAATAQPAGEATTNAPTATEKHSGEATTIDTDTQSYDQETHSATFTGHVVIRYKGATLTADRVRYYQESKDAFADGNVRLNRDSQEWVAKSLFYNFDTHAMRGEGVRGFFDPVFMTAPSVTLVSSNHYTAPSANITTCDYETPDYHVRASHAEVYPGDRVVAFNTSLWIGPVPVFWLPVTAWSLKGDTPPVALTFGHNSRWGGYVQTTTTWQLNPNLSLAAHIDEYTKRGVGAGPDLSYEFGKDVRGELNGWYLNDADPRNSNDPNAGKGLPESRWLGEWRHKELFPADVSLTIDVNKQSDRDVVNDFFPDQYRRDNEPATTFDVSKRGDNYELSALARPQFNSFYDEVERLPEVSLAINRTRIGPTPLFYESQSSVGYLNNYATTTNNVAFDPTFTGETLRVDTFHQISSPQMLFGWLSFVPRAGGRYTYYDRAPNAASDEKDASRFVGALGADVSFKLSRTWSDVQNKTFGIDGLRHIIQPFTDYQWIPTPNVKSNELFQFDTVRSTTLSNGSSLVVTRYLPLEMPANNLVDAIDLEDTIRFGLRQKLQTQRDGLPWDLIELTAWTDYHLERVQGEPDFSDLFGTLDLHPSEWVAFESFTRYDFQAGVLQEFNTAARVGKPDQWSVGLGTRYLKGDSNQVTGDVALRLSRHWTFQTYQRVDVENDRWQDQDYSLRQELHDWYITYGFRYQQSQGNSDNKTFYISVTLKAFPSAKLAAN